MSNNNRKITPILKWLPICATVLFLSAILSFFCLNTKAFHKLNALNLLQYNLQRVDYTFIMSLFAYAIPGVLMVTYFLFIFLNYRRKSTPEVLLLLLASALLILLGSISTSPELKGRTMCLLIVSWLFPILHAVATLIIAIKIRKSSKVLFCSNLILSIYIFYQIPFKLFFFDDGEVMANPSILICFLWYLSYNRLLSNLLKEA